jgi:hypothetical protein
MKLLIGALLLAIFAAAPDQRYFKYQRPIENATAPAGQTCIALDSEIYAHAAPQLADLRLYRDGTETPYVIRTSAPVKADRKTIVPLNLGIREGKTVFDAEMPDEHYGDLELTIAAQDFIATVTVSGDRMQTDRNRTTIGAFTVFDLTRQRLGRSTILHLPVSDFRFLHFSVSGPLKPENITGLSVDRPLAGHPKYQTVAETAHVTQKGHLSILELTVPPHVPVERIAFSPGSQPALFSRDVNINVAPIVSPASSDATEPERAVTAAGTLLRVHSIQDGHKIDEERLVIDAPWTDFARATRWTVTIDNGDDVPLSVERVQLRMLERKLCFEAAANARYVLFFGDSALTAPHYDYATLFAPQADVSLAAMGTEKPNPAYRSRPDERPFTERHPALLWVALTAVIALLGGIVLRSVKLTAQ